MYQRDDGIVEFDADRCIGCKACLQACPYDAIYIDPNSGTAAKCHYCAHRTDIGLEPACVVVCPEHAIIAGDLDDPASEISQVLAKEKVSVRKPEQGTAPKLFYIDGDDVALTPTATDPRPATFMWADVLEDSDRRDAEANVQGHPAHGPIQISPARMADHMVQVGYNAQHHAPWHWPVPAYLVTKGIAAGAFMVAAVAWLTGLVPTGAENAFFGFASVLSLVFVGLTTVLLVYDLERPTRFLSILRYPQWNSWLVRGAFILIGFSLVAGVWMLAEALGVWSDAVDPAAYRGPLLAVGLPLAVGTACYTAFLFGQAEGRDLWQSTLLPVHLVVQATMVGSAALGLLGWAGLYSGPVTQLIWWTFVMSLAVDLFVTLGGEFAMPHATDVAASAAHAITKGRYRHHFWLGSILVGHIVPLAMLIAVPIPATVAVASVLTIAGLYWFEYAFVMAPPARSELLRLRHGWYEDAFLFGSAIGHRAGRASSVGYSTNERRRAGTADVQRKRHETGPVDRREAPRRPDEPISAGRKVG